MPGAPASRGEGARQSGACCVDSMLIDPFGGQIPRPVQRRFRVVDPIQRRAGLKRGHIVCQMLAKITERRDNSTLASPLQPTGLLAHRAIPKE